MAESFTVVFNVRRHQAEPSTVAGSTYKKAVALPPITPVTGLSGTTFDALIVTLEAESAAEALAAARQFYRFDAGVGFAVKTSAVTYESI